MNREVDALIIGGGPAGLAAGIALAACGLETMVCEKRRLPADKACGEGVMPTGLAHLESLGVTRHLAPGGSFPFDGIRYISCSGRTAEAAFREGPGRGIPRLELSAALLKRARELECLEMRDGTPVTVMERDDEGALIRVQAGEDYISTRLLVGADGLRSAVRRWAGLDGPKGTHQRWGARQHFVCRPWSRSIEIYWADGMEAYVTPCGEELVGVAFLWDRRRHPGLRGGDGLIPGLLEPFPALAARLGSATIADAPRALGPMECRARGPAADGVLLIGDAAGYLDALTGEGISVALAQATALQRTVAPLLREGRDMRITRNDLRGYEQAYREIMRPYYALTRPVLWLSEHPALAEIVIALLGRWPGLFQRLLSANMGGYRGRGPRAGV